MSALYCYRRSGAPWDDRRTRDLTRLWFAGAGAAKIGEILGISKDAVIGKVNRLKLPPRPSPIKRRGV